MNGRQAEIQELKVCKRSQGEKYRTFGLLRIRNILLYPTQKNEKMIERIISQSSDENSIILDCFAGGGTTLAAAESLHRKWIGIDNSEEAIKIIRARLQNSDFTQYDLCRKLKT